MELDDIVKAYREFRAKGLQGDHFVLMLAVLQLAKRKPGYLIPVTRAQLVSATDIPFETVRRKMHEMVSRKIVDLVDNKYIPADPSMWGQKK
jgi:CRP-like cAMP-binding protein